MIKWKVLAILALGFFTTPRTGVAQSEWSLEVLGGGNWGNITPQDPLNNYHIPNTPLGEFGINKAFGKYWSLDMRVEFIQRRIQYSHDGPLYWNVTGAGSQVHLFTVGSEDTSNDANDQILNYLQFPITVRISAPVGRLHTYAFAGIAPGIFLSGHTHVKYFDSSYYGDSFTIDTTFASGSFIHSLLISFIGGMGVGYDVTSRLMLLAEASYEYGVSSMSNGAYVPYYAYLSTSPLSDNPLNNRDLHFELGIAFAL